MSYSGRMQRSHILSTFYAPRGRNRIYDLGIQIAQMYLSPFDKLIGVIGDSGSGKSVLIRGMFPGLELTNDDGGVNVRPLPLMDQDSETGFFTPHTYHVDIRFEMGFTQPHELADAIMQAVHRGKRVVVEHFDLIYPFLSTNANLLIGVGEEILVARPNPFGPFPDSISRRCQESLKYRLMAHTAEDLCEFCIPPEERDRAEHDDIHHGFILAFPEYKPTWRIWSGGCWQSSTRMYPLTMWTKATLPLAVSFTPVPAPEPMCPLPAMWWASTWSSGFCWITSTNGICWWAA